SPLHPERIPLSNLRGSQFQRELATGKPELRSDHLAWRAHGAPCCPGKDGQEGDGPHRPTDHAGRAFDDSGPVEAHARSEDCRRERETTAWCWRPALDGVTDQIGEGRRDDQVETEM